jgi:hypothetical protein
MPALVALGADATLALVVDHVLAGGFSALALVLAIMATGGFLPEGGPVEIEAASANDSAATATALSAVNDAVPAQLSVSEPSDAPTVRKQGRDRTRDEEFNGLVRQVRSLEGQIASLSSAMARTGLAPAANLDLAGPEVTLLVSRNAQGRQARNALLSAYPRPIGPRSSPC